jgi:hypothetical protein
MVLCTNCLRQLLYYQEFNDTQDDPRLTNDGAVIIPLHRTQNDLFVAVQGGCELSTLIDAGLQEASRQDHLPNTVPELGGDRDLSIGRQVKRF